jgi:hypothetical protein
MYISMRVYKRVGTEHGGVYCVVLFTEHAAIFLEFLYFTDICFWSYERIWFLYSKVTNTWTQLLWGSFLKAGRLYISWIQNQASADLEFFNIKPRGFSPPSGTYKEKTVRNVIIFVCVSIQYLLK